MKERTSTFGIRANRINGIGAHGRVSVPKADFETREAAIEAAVAAAQARLVYLVLRLWHSFSGSAVLKDEAHAPDDRVMRAH